MRTAIIVPAVPAIRDEYRYGYTDGYTHKSAMGMGMGMRLAKNCIPIPIPMPMGKPMLLPVAGTGRPKDPIMLNF